MKSKHAYRFPLHLVLILLAAALDACQSSSPSAEAAVHYAASIPNSEAFIGVAIVGREVTAYVCDGTDASVATLSEWFKGSLSGNSFDLTSANGARLTGSLASDAITGMFSPAGDEGIPFTASKAVGSAGLFRSEETFNGDKYVAGWIILSDGRQRGAASYEPGGGLGKLAITPIPIPRLPDTQVVITSLGTFNVKQIGNP